jgi:two-component system chemotaxis response regulator CheY
VSALVVDDSPTMRKIAISYLAEVGIREVDEAGDGDEAVALAAQKTYEVILLDWNMPKMSGFDALRAIRAGGNRVPVIMVTTESERLRMIEALKVGANNFVLKPFTKEHLITAVRKTLGLAPASS